MIEIERKGKVTRGNQSSEKLLYLLEILAEQELPIRLQNLAQILDMNVSTTLRFLTALQKRGYVAQETSSGRYFLTYKLCQLANNITGRMNISRVCDAFMHSVAECFGESVNLSVEQDMQVIYIVVLNGRSNLLTTCQRIGSIAPMHCTGAGKLMLTNYDEPHIAQYIERRGLQRYTPNTIIDSEALVCELETVRRNNYAFDNEECEMGMRCVASPIRDYSGQIVAVISISGPTVRMTSEAQEKMLHYLNQGCGDISAQLGYIPQAEDAKEAPT